MPDAEEQQYSKEEISLHNRDGDLWVIIENVVFNLSKFQEDHPGGKKSSFHTTYTSQFNESSTSSRMQHSNMTSSYSSTPRRWKRCHQKVPEKPRPENDEEIWGFAANRCRQTNRRSETGVNIFLCSFSEEILSFILI